MLITITKFISWPTGFEKTPPLWGISPKGPCQVLPQGCEWTKLTCYFRGAAKLWPPTHPTHLDGLFESLLLSGLRGGEGKVKWGGRREQQKRKPPPYLESKFFTKVGEQILIPVSCFAVQPHHVVRAPRDPAANQLHHSTQTLSLAGF